jgi:lipopolysaccharide biosynthesis glycosyltransferase
MTHPRIKALAERVGAEFRILDSAQPLSTHYRIMDLHALFDTYERILHIDSDIIVIKGCPDPFKVVPEDCIGTVYEDKGSRADDRHMRIGEIQKRFGEVGWKTGYLNTGFIMASRMHKEIFTPINEEEFWDAWGWDDVHLGYQIHKMGFKVFELPWQWNAMSMFFEPWNGGLEHRPDKHTAELFMVHHAGCGSSDEGIKKKYLELKRDIELFERLGK